MKNLLLFLFVTTSLLSNSCATNFSEVTLSNSSTIRNDKVIQKDDSLEFVGTADNDKYGLSVLFYRDKANKLLQIQKDGVFFDNIIIRQNGTNKQSNPIKITEGFPSVFYEVWSPNKEYLLLTGSVCEQVSFCVYKTADIVEALKQSATFQMPPATDFITLIFLDYNRQQQKGELARCCSYYFVNWDNEASFVFGANLFENKDGRGKFKYNLLQQTVSGTSNGFPISSSSEYGFKAKNKNGELKFVRE